MTSKINRRFKSLRRYSSIVQTCKSIASMMQTITDRNSYKTGRCKDLC